MAWANQDLDIFGDWPIRIGYQSDNFAIGFDSTVLDSMREQSRERAYRRALGGEGVGGDSGGDWWDPTSWGRGEIPTIERAGRQNVKDPATFSRAADIAMRFGKPGQAGEFLKISQSLEKQQRENRIRAELQGIKLDDFEGMARVYANNGMPQQASVMQQMSQSRQKFDRGERIANNAEAAWLASSYLVNPRSAGDAVKRIGALFRENPDFASELFAIPKDQREYRKPVGLELRGGLVVPLIRNTKTGTIGPMSNKAGSAEDETIISIPYQQFGTVLGRYAAMTGAGAQAAKGSTKKGSDKDTGTGVHNTKWQNDWIKQGVRGASEEFTAADHRQGRQYALEVAGTMQDKHKLPGTRLRTALGSIAEQAMREVGVETFNSKTGHQVYSAKVAELIAQRFNIKPEEAPEGGTVPTGTGDPATAARPGEAAALDRNARPTRGGGRQRTERGGQQGALAGAYQRTQTQIGGQIAAGQTAAQLEPGDASGLAEPGGAPPAAARPPGVEPVEGMIGNYEGTPRQPFPAETLFGADGTGLINRVRRNLGTTEEQKNAREMARLRAGTEAGGAERAEFLESMRTGLAEPGGAPAGREVGSQPLGLRNNNPGNIRTSDENDWQGKVTEDGAPFEKFDTVENGLRAMARVLRNYGDRDGKTTLRRIIRRYAPPSENDTAAYVRFVAQQTGIQPSDVVDVTDPAVVVPLMRAMIRIEQGQQPFSDDQLRRAVEAARPRA